MTYLTSSILEMGCLFRAYETSGFAISSSMTVITALLLLFRQFFFHSLNTFKGPALFCICHKTLIFLFMAGLTCKRTYISGCFTHGLTNIKREIHYGRQEKDRYKSK